MADNVEEACCQVCGKSNPKYRCPGCARRTCSLACVKCHKKQFLCSGTRCKTKFISVAKYTDSDLLSDYRFLEDVDRLAYTAAHDRQRSRKCWGTKVSLLRRKAKERGVELRLMPLGMSKRKENSSMFHIASQRIMWRIRWLFPQAGVEYVDMRVSELLVLSDVLKKYIDPKEADPVYRQSLKNYNAIGVQGVLVFLKVEPLPACKLRYYQLDTSQTIKECLANKTIVEFPTLHVVLPNKVASYPTTDQNETSAEVAESVKVEEGDLCELSLCTSVPSAQSCMTTCQGDTCGQVTVQSQENTCSQVTMPFQEDTCSQVTMLSQEDTCGQVSMQSQEGTCSQVTTLSQEDTCREVTTLSQEDTCSQVTMPSQEDTCSQVTMLSQEDTCGQVTMQSQEGTCSEVTIPSQEDTCSQVTMLSQEDTCTWSQVTMSST